MMKNILSLLAITTSVFAFAQENNLVPNPSFEEVEKKVKSPGQIEYATGWKAATLGPVDLYSEDAKSEEVGVPANSYGEEKAMTGKNYAGISFYSYKDKEPRGYLQAKLKEPLKKGEKYCVQFNVSFADLSKYAVNNLGLYISEDAISAKNNDVLKAEPQIVHRKNRIFSKQFWWETICGEYTAKGGEEYITIGNFKPSDATLSEKVKRPRGFTKPQTYDGYYYIDDVSVVNSKNVENCQCELIAGGKAEVINKEFKSDPNAVEEVEVNGLEITFAPKSSAISAEANKKLDGVIAYLKENETTKIVIIGHIDASEKAMAVLAQKRAEAASKYIVSKGISQDRIKVESKTDTEPKDETGTPEGQKANMRIEFSVPQ